MTVQRDKYFASQQQLLEGEADVPGTLRPATRWRPACTALCHTRAGVVEVEARGAFVAARATLGRRSPEPCWRPAWTPEGHRQGQHNTTRDMFQERKTRSNLGV